MKRAILYSVILCSVTLFSMPKAVAQEPAISEQNNTSSQAPKFIYCTITGYYSVFKEYMSVEIDFGQKRTDYKKSLQDHRGKLTDIYSMAGAMNYLSKDGWEFVQAYVTVDGRNNKTDSQEHWILRKEVNNMTEEEIEDFLYSYVSKKK